MPKYKKRSYRKRYRKKRGYALSKRIQSSPMPQQFKTTLKYVEQFTINPGTGLAAVHVFSGNGCWDPNITGTGHQPRGFDQLMLMYDHYVVIGSKIKWKFSTTDTVGTMFTLATTDSANVSSDINNYAEHNTSVSTIIGGDLSSRTLSIGGSPRKTLGRSNPLSDPELKGTQVSLPSNGNPTEQYYFHCAAEATDGSGNPTAVACLVEIDYLVVFIEMKRINQS